MSVHELNPLEDHRWRDLVDRHPESSVFHTPEWLSALSRTYGYTPRAFSSSPSDSPLMAGIVFCEVKSWLTGTRLVSLPFSDHCEPLVQDPSDLEELLTEVWAQTQRSLKYVEIRPRVTEPASECGFESESAYSFHALDLTPCSEAIYRRFHKSSIQRKIRRADREHVVVDRGRSERILEEFYALLLLTRRRHGLPPQPFEWFKNLADCFGNRLVVYVARVDDQPIASILTLRHKNTCVYKYGCSDVQFHPLGGMPRLFWQAIEEAKTEGFDEMDLGRSDNDNGGLIRFKNQLGAIETSLTYYRRSQESSNRQVAAPESGVSKLIMSHLPDRFLRLAGEVFYRHAG